MFLFDRRGFNNKAEIFIHGAELERHRAGEWLRKEDAEKKEDKAVWLLRQSTSYPKQIVVSYYRNKSEELDACFAHQRIGLTENGWKIAPGEKRIDFKERMKEFNDALVSIVPEGDEKNLMPVLSQEVDTLLEFLEGRGFFERNLLKPNYNIPCGFKNTGPAQETASASLEMVGKNY